MDEYVKGKKDSDRATMLIDAYNEFNTSNLTFNQEDAAIISVLQHISVTLALIFDEIKNSKVERGSIIQAYGDLMINKDTAIDIVDKWILTRSDKADVTVEELQNRGS